MKRYANVSLLAAMMFAAGGFSAVHAGEIQGGATTAAKPMSSKLSPVTQQRLNNASRDKANWLHSNGDYAQTRFYPGTRSTPATSPSSSPRSFSRPHWSNPWKPRR